MRCLIFCIFIFGYFHLANGQSLRPMEGFEYGPALYSAKHRQLYIFEGVENRPSRIKIVEDRFGKLKKTIVIDSLPQFRVMSTDERFIYFVTRVPLKINKFDLDLESVVSSILVPGHVQDINSLNLVPNREDRLVITWFNEQRAGIALFDQGKWVDAPNTGIFAFHGTAIPNDSTFYATSAINYTFIKGKISAGAIAITDTISGLPNLELDYGIMQEGYYYQPQGYLIDFRRDTPVVSGQLAPTSPLGYNKITSFPASPYVYFIEDLFNAFKVYKITKAGHTLQESWTIPKEPGSSSFTLLIATENDGFFLSNYSRSYLYKRCTPQVPAAAIQEGYSVQACLLKDSTVTLNAAHQVYEYLWSNGASGSALVLNSGASVALQYGDSLGCLAVASPFANVNFYPPRNGPWLDGKSEAFSIQTCARQEVYLTAMESGIQQFEWSNGAMGSTILVNQAGTYRVRSIDATGCPSLWSAPVSIEQLPDTIPAKPVIQTVKGSLNYCEGDIAELYVPAGYNYYIWQGQKTNTPAWKVNSSQWVSVQVGNDPRCLSAYAEPAKLNFYPQPQSSSIQRLGNTLATNNAGETHEWYLNEQLIPDEKGQFLTIVLNGTYKVRTSVDGCFSNFSTAIVVQDLITSDRDLDPVEFTLKVYPNPVQEILHIPVQGLGKHSYLYQLYSMEGSLQQYGFLTSKGLLNVNALPSGAYYLLIKSDQGKFYSARFIKH